MKTALSILRLILEGLLGTIILLTIPFSLLNTIAQRAQATTPYLLGSLFGMTIMALLGLFLVRDAIRVGRRLRQPVLTSPSASSNTST